MARRRTLHVGHARDADGRRRCIGGTSSGQPDNEQNGRAGHRPLRCRGRGTRHVCAGPPK
eukprot:scaffold28143_cov152-Isochrysis_galbana.AAC.3